MMLLGYIWVLFVGAAVAPALAHMAWTRRAVPGMRPLAVFALAAGGWCVAALLYTTSADAVLTPLWFRLQYAVSSSLAPAIAVFAYQRCVGRNVAPWWLWAPLAAEVLLNLVVAATDPQTQLWWARLEPNPDSGALPLLFAERGAWGRLQLVFAVLVSLGSMAALAVTLWQSSGRGGRSSVAPLLAVLPTYALAFATHSPLNPVPGMELGAAGMAVSLVLWTYLAPRSDFFGAPLVNRNDVVEDSIYPYIAVDANGVVADANALALRLLNVDAAVGKPASQVLAGMPELLALTVGTPSVRSHTASVRTAGSVYEFSAMPWRGPDGKLVGVMLRGHDYTAEAEVRDQKERLSAILQIAGNGVVVTNADGTMIEANVAAALLLATAGTPLTLGSHFPPPELRLIRQDGTPLAPREFAPTLAFARKEAVYDQVVGVECEDRYFWWSVNSSPLFRSGEDEPYAIVSSVFDFSKLREAQQEVLRTLYRIDAIVQSAPVAIWTCGRDGMVESWNPTAEAMFGWSASEVVGGLPPFHTNIDEEVAIQETLSESRSVSNVETVRERKDGRPVDISLSVAPLDPLGLESVSIAVDITERKIAEQKLREAHELLERQAQLDGLTGLANRRRFDEILDLAWRDAARQQQSVAVVMCDVDFFKKYNDTYGHMGGDNVLRKVAAELAAAVRRPGDLAARYGGEEFVLLLPNTTLEGARAVAEGVRERVQALAIPSIEAPLGTVTMSLGVCCVVPAPGSDQVSLLVEADTALYRAKQGGRNRVETTTISPDELIADAA